MKAYDRHPDDTRYSTKDGKCEVCATPFQKIKRHQKFCSEGCYKIGWLRRNPEKNRAKSRERRRAVPEWYREKEPKYYRDFRARHSALKPWMYALKSAKNRAKNKKWIFELDDKWADKRWTGRCEITGMHFIKNDTHGPHPYSVSIDRIDSKKGYTQENSRFILWGCNAIRGVGNDIDMYRIAKAITLTTLNAIVVEASLSLPI